MFFLYNITTMTKAKIVKQERPGSRERFPLKTTLNLLFLSSIKTTEVTAFQI